MARFHVLFSRSLGLVFSILPAPRQRGPGPHFRWRIGWLRGWYHRIKVAIAGFFVEQPRLICGKRLCSEGPLLIRGRGTIIIGDDVILGYKTALLVSPRSATIRIGDRSYLNGVECWCIENVTIGNDNILGDVRIMDSNFHAVNRRRHDSRTPIKVAPVTLKDNVWVAGRATILRGVTVGENSVIGLGSIVIKDVPSNCVVAGNPARVVGTVPE